MNKIEKAFDAIKAKEETKEKTLRYIMDMEEEKKPKVKKYAWAVITVLIITFMGAGYYTFTVPVTYISIDVNPSIELEVNRFNKVVGVEAYNEDGEKIVAGLTDVKNRDYLEVLNEFMQNEDIAQYAKDGEEFLFTVVSVNDKEIVNRIEKNSNYKNLKGEYKAVDESLMEKAHSENMSVGRYCKYIDAKEAGSDVTVEDCKDMTIKELNKLCEGEKTHKEKAGNHH